MAARATSDRQSAKGSCCTSATMPPRPPMPGTDSLPFLLTVDETASLLRTTKKAIYTMVERGQIPGVTRLGRRVLVRSEDLLRWLDHNRTPSSNTPKSHSAQATSPLVTRPRK